jgi:transcriptional regulator GlxA family with amidase domain
LLDGRRVTTHWRFASDVARQFPAVKMQANAIFMKDDCFYTSAGVTTGIDLALALIEEDHPGPLALGVGRELVVHHKRAGGQEQYSEPFRFQVEANDRLGEVAAWAAAHLGSSLTVESLAERACMSPRHFARAFKHAFGTTPADFVERQRLDRARERLIGSRRTIAHIAQSIGFRSADAFSRAFQRCYGLTPSIYRRSRGSADTAGINTAGVNTAREPH